TFYARIDTSDGKRISARPSDAVLLALTADAPVYVAESVLDADGIDAPEPDEEAVAQFREFLDHVSAEDFSADERPDRADGGSIPADEGSDPASAEAADAPASAPDTEDRTTEEQDVEQDDAAGGDDTTDDGASADDSGEDDEDSR